MLARQPQDIFLKEIIETVEGSIAPVQCVDDPHICENSATCATHLVWKRLKTAISDVLASVNLKDLAEQDRSMQDKKQNSMYHI